jgi:hypothetical protein
MRKTYPHFEQVPVAVAEKILEQQSSLAKRDGTRKRAVRKSEKTLSEIHALSRKVEVLVP